VPSPIARQLPADTSLIVLAAPLRSGTKRALHSLRRGRYRLRGALLRPRHPDACPRSPPQRLLAIEQARHGERTSCAIVIFGLWHALTRGGFDDPRLCAGRSDRSPREGAWRRDPSPACVAHLARSPVLWPTSAADQKRIRSANPHLGRTPPGSSAGWDRDAGIKGMRSMTQFRACVGDAATSYGSSAPFEASRGAVERAACAASGPEASQ
jgi:hypothetical protein